MSFHKDTFHQQPFLRKDLGKKWKGDYDVEIIIEKLEEIYHSLKVFRGNTDFPMTPQEIKRDPLVSISLAEMQVKNLIHFMKLMRLR